MLSSEPPNASSRARIQSRAASTASRRLSGKHIPRWLRPLAISSSNKQAYAVRRMRPHCTEHKGDSAIGESISYYRGDPGMSNCNNIPALWAANTAAISECTPSRQYIVRRCESTVAAEIPRHSAMASRLYPCAMRLNICTCLRLKSPTLGLAKFRH